MALVLTSQWWSVTAYLAPRVKMSPASINQDKTPRGGTSAGAGGEELSGEWTKEEEITGSWFHFHWPFREPQCNWINISIFNQRIFLWKQWNLGITEHAITKHSKMEEASKHPCKRYSRDSLTMTYICPDHSCGFCEICLLHYNHNITVQLMFQSLSLFLFI